MLTIQAYGWIKCKEERNKCKAVHGVVFMPEIPCHVSWQRLTLLSNYILTPPTTFFERSVYTI
jgi:hypothetical protein